MRATLFLTFSILLFILWATARSIANGDTDGGLALALPPGTPPPLSREGLLSYPRSNDQVGLPLALTASVIPPSTPLTTASIALGEKLFFESRLSINGTVACATCHDPARAFTDGRPKSVGISGHVGQRNAPTVLNALYNTTQFWDGRVYTLEQQAALPITNPFEMGSPSIGDAASRISQDENYQARFKEAFGRSVNEQDMLRAIATYERTLTSFDSPFDQFIAGDANSIDASAKRGWELFNTKARCNLCHARSAETPDVTVFTDNGFHNIGIGILNNPVGALAEKAEHELVRGDQLDIDIAAIEGPMSVLGRFLITKRQKDVAAFKTPDLRNVLITGPYFHDGSMQTLWDVVDHYNHGDGVSDPWLDVKMQPLALTEPEIDDLVAFLASLTSATYKTAGQEEYARQYAHSRIDRPQRDTARAFGPKPIQPKPPPL
jgi:cytochrome c peroxidase